MKRIFAAVALFKAGNSVLDPAKWKNRQVTVTALTTAIWAAIRLGESYGLTVEVNDALVDSIAVAILGVVNLVLTFTTSEKVGLPNRDKQSLMDKGDKSSH